MAKRRLRPSSVVLSVMILASIIAIPFGVWLYRQPRITAPFEGIFFVGSGILYLLIVLVVGRGASSENPDPHEGFFY